MTELTPEKLDELERALQVKLDAEKRLRANLTSKNLAALDAADAQLGVLLDDNAEELVRAARERQWIPVSERLPEPYTKVALVNSGQFENAPFDTPVHGAGYWVPEFFGYWDIRGERPLTRDSFTHWMPLPEVPHD